MGHKLQMYENLRDMLEREVSAIEHKQELDENSLDNLFKLTTAIKVVDKCIDRENEEQNPMAQMRGNSYIGNRYVYSRDGGMSNDGMSNDSMSNHYPMPINMRMPIYYRDAPMMTAGTSNDGMSNDYSRNNSYARKGKDGDGDGRYNESSNGQSYGYSRDASRKKMVQKLETLMDDTMSESERTAIQDCINRIK